MKIEYLADHPEHLETVSGWLFKQWGRPHPHADTREGIAELLKSSKRGGIPTAFISLEENTITGTASLTEDDMREHPELSPWLASVFVLPEHRNKGTAAALVKRVIREASLCGVKTLYLFTYDNREYYLKMGFREMFEDLCHGEPVTVMSYDVKKEGL